MSAAPATVAPMGTGDWTLSDREVEDVFGPFCKREPADAAALFQGYPGLWFIAGGWAVEAFTGRSREHHDIDPCVLRSDLELFRAHLRGRYTLWSASSGAIRPVFDTLPAGDNRLLLEGCAGIWLRPGWDQPWEYDVLLAPGDRDTWVYKRDPSITMPMADALWTRDGISYLQPEIQLLYKARGLRPQDWADFNTALPLLGDGRRRWLADGLRQTEPGHPWLQRL